MTAQKQKVIMKLKNDDFIQKLGDLLFQTGKVKVTGFGIFEIRYIAAREGYDVYNKKMIRIKARNKLVFRASANFKKIIQNYGKEA